MRTSPSIRFVAVVGGSGAGKTWLVARLCRLLGRSACHLQLDDFYRDRSHLPLRRRGRINFDLPRTIDWTGFERVLRDCRAGRPTRLPRYDFATYSRRAEMAPWQPRPIVFVDGLWLLRRPASRALFDLKIYVDAPEELRCSRRLVRDVAERGYTAGTVRRQLRSAVLPMHARFVAPQKKWADIVLAPPLRESMLRQIADRIRAMIVPKETPRPRRRERQVIADRKQR